MMADLSIENLDLACAKAAQAMAEHPSNELRKLVTDALSVLEEQGVYALFLFLSDREKKNEKTITKYLKRLLESTPAQKPLIICAPGASGSSRSEGCESVIRSVREELVPDIEKLLLAQSLLRQTLVYARYQAEPEEMEQPS